MTAFDHISGKYLNIDDARIYYEVLGNEEDPALLFLHGGGGHIEIFNDIIPKIHGKFRLIGIDNRGHGKSTLGSKELSYELLQKEVEKVLAHLNINTLTILGFSNGGTVAYRLAALTNLNINKLITIGAPWCDRQFEHLLEDVSNLTVEEWKEHCPSDYKVYHRVNPEPDFKRLLTQAVKMGLDMSDTGRPNEQVKNISCPLLAIRGETDAFVSAQDLIELSEIVKTTQIVNIPAAGHVTFQDQPSLFAEKLNEFLMQ